MDLLDPLILSRWQFALTILYHFLFVPITIGLAFSCALFQTAWYRTAKVKYLQITRFLGKIFLINFAMGVVTGIVQEFQFGMNWSVYSRFVGDVFGAPLAMEGLLAFFFEATFIGVWIFGWDRVPKWVHLASIWFTSIGTMLSAAFIIAANSFMQNPVGFHINHDRGRAELVDIWAVLTNPVALAALPHTIFAAFMVGAGVIIAVAAWHLSRNQHLDTMKPMLKFGCWFMIIAFAGTAFFGDRLGTAMVETQPMKMAAAEAAFYTVTGADASFSIFTLGTPDGTSSVFSLRIPYLLSILATHSLDGTVEGLNELNAQYQQAYGPGDYIPLVWVTYWSFRWMIGLGAYAFFLAILGLWLTRKGRQPKRWQWKIAIWSAPASIFAMNIGWIFTEMGRQPWIVFSLLKTEDAVSPNVSGLSVLISIVLFTLLYGVLAVIELGLIIKAVHAGPEEIVVVERATQRDDGDWKPQSVAEARELVTVKGSVY